MSTNTTNYNLKKPDTTDNYNVADQNGNMDIIDAALKPTADIELVPAGLVGKMSEWVSWIANRIKAITGKSNWFDTPSTTLETANTHINAAAPHSGHETPAGAQSKANAAEAYADSAVNALAGAGNTKTVKQLADEAASHVAETATTTTIGHVQLGTTADKAAVGNHNHTGVYQPVDATLAKFKNGIGTYTDNDTSQTFIDAFCTANSLVVVSITSGTLPQGTWAVNSAAGNFTITSTVAESVDITFDYSIIKVV